MNSIHSMIPVRYKNNLRYSVLIGVLILLISNNVIHSSQRKTKTDVKPAARPCCVLGVSTVIGKSSVVLEQICKTGNSMAIYFHTKDMAGTCVHPPSTLLTDQNSKRYSLISSIGLPECAKGKLNEKPNIQFSWIFQSFGAEVKSFTLREVEDSVTMGMLYWIWEDVDVSHCKF